LQFVVQSSPFLQTHAALHSQVDVEVGPASGTEPFVPDDEEDDVPPLADDDDEDDVPSPVSESEEHARTRVTVPQAIATRESVSELRLAMMDVRPA